MNVADLMTKKVLTVGVFTSLKGVASLLVEHGISGVPVVDDEGHVLGVVSEADILTKERTKPTHSVVFATLHPDRIIDEELRLDARTAGEAMTTPAVTITPDRPVAKAAALMLDEGVNRLPVVESERLVGIVTRADLVRAFVRSDEEIQREISQDIVLRQLWLEPAQVAISVRGGHVTLRGDVDAEANVELLPVLVECVPGVVSVTADLAWKESRS